MADKKYFIITDYVVAGILMAHKQIPLIREDKFNKGNNKMVFLFKSTDEFIRLYQETRNKERNE